MSDGKEELQNVSPGIKIRELDDGEVSPCRLVGADDGDFHIIPTLGAG